MLLPYQNDINNDRVRLSKFFDLEVLLVVSEDIISNDSVECILR